MRRVFSFVRGGQIAAGALVLLLSSAATVSAAPQYIFGFSGSNAGNVLTVNGGTNLTFLDQGWYFQGGQHTPGNPNYIVGTCDVCALSGEYRNWFAFDISNLRAPVTSLNLTLFSYDVTLTSGNYYLNDYVGSVASLIGGTGGVAAFNDLGTGVNFGFRFYQQTESQQFHTIALNSGAVASLNAAINAGASQWAFGGSFLAGSTPIPPTSAPEPASMLLLGTGLLGAGVQRWRQKRA